MISISNLIQTRTFLSKLIKDYTQEQMEVIPEGFSNNILWNLAHLVVTQQSLHYALSGNKLLVDELLVAENRKGTSPKDWTNPPRKHDILELLETLPKQLQTDYDQGKFQDYKSYRTSIGITLSSIEEAIIFNNYHEGIHLGTILALRKFL